MLPAGSMLWMRLGALPGTDAGSSAPFGERSVEALLEERVCFSCRLAMGVTRQTQSAPSREKNE